ncbi:MAG: hypothetical protein NT009_09590, partial [Proteobacteria bacterium]|nr:hypothetical protein [Pseudomonadota bacterium]
MKKLLVFLFMFVICWPARAYSVEVNWGTAIEYPNSNSFSIVDSNGNTPLKNGDIVHLIYAGANGTIDPPNSMGQPTGDDVLLDTSYIGYGGGALYPDKGFFSKNYSWSGTYGQKLFVRAFNDTISNATYFGDSYLRTYQNPPDDLVNMLFECTDETHSLSTNIQFAYSPTMVELISFNATGIV